MTYLSESPSGQHYLIGDQDKPIFLSAGFGLEVQKLLPDCENPIQAGSEFIAPLHASETVRKVHELYAKAGADVLTTDTFCASVYRQNGDVGLTKKFVKAAVDLAEAAAKEKAHGDCPLVALSLTSLGDCYHPDDTPDIDVLKIEHAQNIDILKNYGDFIIAETLPTLREAEVIAHFAQEADKPFLVAFTVDEEGKVLDGHSMENVVKTVLEPHAACLGVGVNCCTIEGAQKAVSELGAIFNNNADLDGKHIVVYPNGFRATRKKNASSACEHNSHATYDPEEFSEILREMVNNGATIIGGCCGAGPEHTQEYTNIKLPVYKTVPVQLVQA